MPTAQDNRPAGFTPKKVILLATGWVLVVIGPIVGILPGPGGIPIVGAGLVLILSQSYTAKRVFVRWERRFPRVLGPVRRFISRGKGSAGSASRKAQRGDARGGRGVA